MQKTASVQTSGPPINQWDEGIKGRGKLGSCLAWTVPTAFHAVDDLLLELLPFLFFGHVIAPLFPAVADVPI